METNNYLELLAPVALNVVCFRFRDERCPEATLNSINREILVRLQESGIAVLSGTTQNGQFALRAAITNYRSRTEDFEITMRAIVEIGQQIGKGKF